MCLIYILPLLCLMGCGMTLETPQQRLVAVAKTASAVSAKVTEYVRECKAKAFDDPCRDNFPAINRISKVAGDAFESAKKDFVANDMDSLAISEAVIKNAANDLKEITDGH